MLQETILNISQMSTYMWFIEWTYVQNARTRLFQMRNLWIPNYLKLTVKLLLCLQEKACLDCWWVCFWWLFFYILLEIPSMSVWGFVWKKVPLQAVTNADVTLKWPHKTLSELQNIFLTSYGTTMIKILAFKGSNCDEKRDKHGEQPPPWWYWLQSTWVNIEYHIKTVFNM